MRTCSCAGSAVNPPPTRAPLRASRLSGPIGVSSTVTRIVSSACIVTPLKIEKGPFPAQRLPAATAGHQYAAFARIGWVWRGWPGVGGSGTGRWLWARCRRPRPQVQRGIRPPGAPLTGLPRWAAEALDGAAQAQVCLGESVWVSRGAHQDVGHGPRPDAGQFTEPGRGFRRVRARIELEAAGGHRPGQRPQRRTKSALNRGATTGAKSHEESGPPPAPPLYATPPGESTQRRAAAAEKTFEPPINADGRGSHKNAYPRLSVFIGGCISSLPYPRLPRQPFRRDRRLPQRDPAIVGRHLAM